ncbi:flagellar basal body-associated FliL family protein [Natronospora cellulosivora (SeqCode)]
MAEGNNALSFKMLILLMFIIIIVTGLFSYLFMSFMMPQEGQNHPFSFLSRETDDDIGPTYNLGEFVVNLTGTRGYQIIRATMVAEVNNKGVIEELEKRSPQIQDTIILTLREQKLEDIEEPGAKVIKSQLMSRLNSLLNSGDVINIWFTQLVVQ